MSKADRDSFAKNRMIEQKRNQKLLSSSIIRLLKVSETPSSDLFLLSTNFHFKGLGIINIILYFGKWIVLLHFVRLYNCVNSGAFLWMQKFWLEQNV